MPKKVSRKQKSRKNTKKKFDISSVIANATIGILMVLVFGFLISVVDRLFFENGTEIDKPDLSKLIAKTKYEIQTGHKIQIEVHNGCGVTKVANVFTEYLRAEGFDVLDSRNAESFDYEQTQILHHQGDRAQAIALGKIMAIEELHIIENKNINITHDLTLIIGKDHESLSSYHTALMYNLPY